MKVINGAKFEGGGQTVRLALGLSAILNQPIKIEQIRAGRPKPGLSNQHLAGARLLAQMSNGRLIDADVNSEVKIGTKNLEFYPSKNTHFTADAKTAGSIGLMAQIALPVAAVMSARQNESKIVLDLEGGTDCDFAPPVRIQETIFASLLRHFGLNLVVNQVRNGFFPVGKGHSIFTLSQLCQKGQIWPKTDDKIKIEAWYSVDKKSAASEKDILAVLTEAEQKISNELKTAEIEIKRETRAGIGNAAGIYAKVGNFKSVTWLAKMNKKGVIVNANGAADAIVAEIRQILEISSKTDLPVLDRHHSDQVLIYGALSSGTVEFVAQPENDKLPSHVQTAAYVINELCGAETVQFLDQFTVRINGIGLI